MNKWINKEFTEEELNDIYNCATGSDEYNLDLDLEELVVFTLTGKLNLKDKIMSHQTYDNLLRLALVSDCTNPYFNVNAYKQCLKDIKDILQHEVDDLDKNKEMFSKNILFEALRECCQCQDSEFNCYSSGCKEYCGIIDFLEKYNIKEEFMEDIKKFGIYERDENEERKKNERKD